MEAAEWAIICPPHWRQLHVLMGILGRGCDVAVRIETVVGMKRREIRHVTLSWDHISLLQIHLR